jgi:outer membrane protein assembly factor BamB
MKCSGLLTLSILALLIAPAMADNWPQFRGPSGDGISGAKSLPLTWDEQHGVKWKTFIHGKAWSSPVVWDKQIWMSTATPDGHELYAVCVDLNSGQIVHDLKVFDIANPQYCIDFNSYASPTPCIEAGRVYVTFGAPGTACLDTATGKVIWARTDFVCNHFRGAGSSPTLYKNLLIMNFDGSDFQYIAALDKETGRTVWRTDRDVDYADIQADGQPLAKGDFRKAFSTPRVASFDGRDVLVSLGSKALYGYEPMTGKEIWRVEVKSSFSGSDTPIFGDGMIFYGTGHGESELMAVRPQGQGNITDHAIVWRIHRHVPTRSSALLADGLIYTVSDAGIVNCVDAKTGAEVWHGRIDGEYSASPILADGRIYFCNQKGLTTVIQPGREFKVLAENALPDGFMACPAVVGKSLLFRTRTHLYRIE